MILIRENQYGTTDLEWHPTLRSFPVRKVRGSLWLRGCKYLRSLPSTLEVGGDFDLDGCDSLTRLPPTLRVSGYLSLESTPVTELPEGLEGLVVGSDLYLHGSNVTHVPKSARIGRQVYGLGEP